MDNFFAGEVSPYARTALRSTLSSGRDPRNAPQLIDSYHKILSPDFPEFLRKYCELPLVQRLRGVGLLCGTDWTPLYSNRFFYSRYDHSVGTALIAWNFTHDKAQTLASLLHDVSTPAFSHVYDFRKGDALTQSATENANVAMICADEKLRTLLAEDRIALEDVCDYHRYPVCDNDIPCLSSDRLEYMFPSGAALHGNWTLPEIKKIYDNIIVAKNEDGIDELAFRDVKCAEIYCQKFCETSHLLQKNENKLALQLLAEIVECAVSGGIIAERDLFEKSEREIISLFDSAVKSASTSHGNSLSRFVKLFRTFRAMTHIEHTDEMLSPEKYFCVSLKVKQRYIDPLVVTGKDAQYYATDMALPVRRLSQISSYAKKIIDGFMEWSDTKYGAVKFI